MSKRVYILGAGFSRPAGVPTQFELTKEIFKKQSTEFKTLTDDLNLLSSQQDRLINFLKDDFLLTQSSEYFFSLEDIYTPLDRCILENSNFRSYAPEELLTLRKTLDSILILALKNKSSLTSDKKFDYIRDFAKHLDKLSRERLNNYKNNDPVAVITTNWDILLDLALREQLNPEEGIIDYMCYVSSLRDDDSIIPGLKALVQKKYIVKLLKIHGSINWLHCPKCERIFIDFYKKVTDYGIFNKRSCKYCTKEHEYDFIKSPKLRTLLLMPTFTKDLNNFQTKLIWRNSGLEISEADELIFIGYSFPYADFEFRQMMFRNIKKNAKITVVLYDDLMPDKILTQKSTEHLSPESAEYRYLSFFGGKNITIRFDGGVNYMKTLV